MAKENMVIRDELKARRVRHWEMAHELGVSEHTHVRWLRFELSEDKQLYMLNKIETIANRKENVLDY